MKEILVRVGGDAHFRKECDCRVQLGRTACQTQRLLDIEVWVAYAHERDADRCPNESVGVDRVKRMLHIQPSHQNASDAAIQVCPNGKSPSSSGINSSGISCSGCRAIQVTGRKPNRSWVKAPSVSRTAR